MLHFQAFWGVCLVSRFKHVFVCYKCVSIYFFRSFMFSLTMCDSGSEYVIYEASPVYYYLKHTFRLVLSRSLYLSVKHTFYYAATNLFLLCLPQFLSSSPSLRNMLCMPKDFHCLKFILLKKFAQSVPLSELMKFIKSKM